MVTYTHIATTAFLVMAAQSASAAATKSKYTAKHRSEFLKAMKGANVDSAKGARRERRLASDETTMSLESFADEANNKEEPKKANWLRKKIFEKATFVPPEKVRERKLQNNNNYGYNNGNNANSAYNSQSDGTDDYYSASGEWDNDFGFDPTQYAMSYLRCAEVKQFDDELAATEDSTSVFATKHFAVFRFCPAKTCEGIVLTEEQIAAQEASAAGSYSGNNQNYNYAMYGSNYNQARNGNNYGDRAEEEGYNRPIVGAAGEGCESNYGEYMLELEDYMTLMAEYRAERFEQYCTYCEQCAYKVYQKWMKWSQNINYTNRKMLDITEDGWKRELETSARDLGDFNPLNYCEEYNTCKIYDDICGAGIDDDLEEYFECAEVERSNGQVAYIGPHCGSDGVTVTLGVYSDENCYDYIGDGVDIRNFLGYELEEDALADYVKGSIASLTILEADVQDYVNPADQLCIPCRAGAQLYEEEGNLYRTNDDYADGDEEINELCTNLYYSSARCDRHFRNYESKTKQSQYYDSQYMELSCDFIDSVVTGDYDETGFIKIDNSTLPYGTGSFLKNNIYYEEYGHFAEEVSPFQIFALVGSLAAVCLLALWSAALHRSLTKKAPWRPRRGLNNMMNRARGKAVGDDPVDISRQNSGIVMGRSQSGGSYYMS